MLPSIIRGYSTVTGAPDVRTSLKAAANLSEFPGHDLAHCPAKETLWRDVQVLRVSGVILQISAVRVLKKHEVR